MYTYLWDSWWDSIIETYETQSVNCTPHESLPAVSASNKTHITGILDS